ncbi:uncharacterized protein LOC133178992 isoform X2 [Saccostrea echinata]|uniref:uncharacterized protein LOC133178992 isoform X2 n=1 Tax=Saccostrea echinata TaxID=191078 RepID=UPI002A80FBD7|nr:uncharacterized protein LOC133178992 isoform X2 [Saccostrea echinata]
MSYNRMSSDGTTITKQPSAQLSPAENGGNNTELETGLEAIEDLDRIILSQEITACGSFVCLFRSCLGSARDLSTRIQDSSGNDVGRFRRAISFRGCCICSCFLPQLTVYHPHSRIGTIRERRTCCRPSFEIVDRTGDILFTFSNDCCYSQYCGWFMNVTVDVKDMEGDVVAKFIKKSFHNSEELVGLENKIHIEFLKKIKAQEKLLLIGAAMLLSLNNFEDSKRLCC